jgi:hypothetical protein
MYRLGERNESHRGFYIWLVAFLVALVGASFVALHFVGTNTHISKAPAPVTHKITYDTTDVTYVEPLFSIAVPSDFKAAHVDEGPQATYTWEGTKGDNTDRWISVYVDNIPTSLAVNRVIHVQSNGKLISVISDVSDNCTTFGAAVSQGSGVIQAKWEGLSFLCDTGNYTRDLVGTVSPDGINNLIMTGTQGKHSFFITYTDNSFSTDYSIFTKALKSFTMK